MNTNSRSSSSAALLFAALLPSTLLATGGEKREPLAWDAAWVESHEASYCNVDGEVIGDEVTGTRHVELSAKALPKSRLTLLKTPEEWHRFIERFAKIGKESGEPEFLSGAGLFADPEREGFAPDFDREVVLILSADKSHKEGVGDFMDIEVFEHEDRLRTFVFFGAKRGRPATVAGASKDPVAGHLYLVSIPRKLANRPVELRMARQSWGRVCSKFSPPISNSDAAEGQPANRAEQGGAGQPANRHEPD